MCLGLCVQFGRELQYRITYLTRSSPLHHSSHSLYIPWQFYCNAQLGTCKSATCLLNWLSFFSLCEITRMYVPSVVTGSQIPVELCLLSIASGFVCWFAIHSASANMLTEIRPFSGIRAKVMSICAWVFLVSSSSCRLEVNLTIFAVQGSRQYHIALFHSRIPHLQSW